MHVKVWVKAEEDDYMISPFSTFWANAGRALMPLETLSITLSTSALVPLSAQAIAFVAFEPLMTEKKCCGKQRCMEKVLFEG